jgi:tripartite-type tricarboxylate transporter receptor subunit TctC
MTLAKTTTALMRCSVANAGMAQEYPSKPITIVAGANPGGPAVMVNNEPRTNTLLATHEVPRANPHGYSFLLSYDLDLVNNPLVKGGRYDPLKNRRPVALAVPLPAAVITPPSSPFKRIQAIVKAVRATVVEVANGSFRNGARTTFCHCPRACRLSGINQFGEYDGNNFNFVRPCLT